MNKRLTQASKLETRSYFGWNKNAFAVQDYSQCAFDQLRLNLSRKASPREERGRGRKERSRLNRVNCPVEYGGLD
jgi:hypothetical protein